MAACPFSELDWLKMIILGNRAGRDLSLQDKLVIYGKPVFRITSFLSESFSF